MFIDATNTGTSISNLSDQAVLSEVSQTVLTILVPTKNESGNIAMLISRIEKAVTGIDTEILFVDDSTDDTPQVIADLGAKCSGMQVRMLHRQEKDRTGGLGGAVVAGMQVAQSPWVCVMDGDLQHPPEVIPQMLKKAEAGSYDLVVASRRVSESDETSLGFTRILISKALDKIARVMFPRHLQSVSDPLTGFFLVRVDAIDLERLHPHGFKILMEILVRNPSLNKSEVPFRFGERFAGKSKASSKEAFNYLKLLLRLRFGDRLFSFSKFAIVGASGIVVNTAVMALFTSAFQVNYLISAVFATIASSTWNFLLTEVWVFRERRNQSGMWRRFILFFAMNNAALLFRGPILFVLTSILGVFYLVSNLISLGILTIVRYFLSDSLIWGESKSGKSSIRSIM